MISEWEANMTISRPMRLLLAPAAGLLLVGSTASAQRYSEGYSAEGQRIEQSVEVLQTLTNARDGDIPGDLLERAEGVVVIPSFVRGGLIVGAEHGDGIMSMREPNGRGWSAPAFVSLSGGSVGAEIGLQATDLVLLVMNRDAADVLLGNEFTFGGSVSIAEGPVGRSVVASSDLSMSAKILAYSRSRRIFAGLTLDGATLRSDAEANARFYGRRVSTGDIVLNGEWVPSRIPVVASRWQDTLQGLAGMATGN